MPERAVQVHQGLAGAHPLAFLVEQLDVDIGLAVGQHTRCSHSTARRGVDSTGRRMNTA